MARPCFLLHITFLSPLHFDYTYFITAILLLSSLTAEPVCRYHMNQVRYRTRRPNPEEAHVNTKATASDGRRVTVF